MTVNKAEMKLVGSTILPQDSSTELNFNIGQINPFVPAQIAPPKQLQVGADGKFIFGNKVLGNEENGLSQRPTFNIAQKLGLTTVINALQLEISSFRRQFESWDTAVDPLAAATIRRNWPNDGNIKMSLDSNPRLLYLAQQANKDYV